MKFKNYIEVQSGIKDSANSPGTLDQVLTSTATGVAWVDPSTISAEAATLVVIECKNTSGATITKGTPVYQTGTVGATDVIEIAPADALISAGAQPAIGLLQTTLNDNGFGKVVITGELLNFTTDPIDGVTPTTGDKVFLKSGGGLTLTKPTGAGNGIQSLGLIGKVSSGSAGSITVSSIMRTNDVPNLPTGKIWVGDGNTVVSDTVFLDEPNGRMGINTTTPTKDLEIGTNAAAETEFRMHSDESGKYFNIQSAGNFTSVKTAGSQNFILDSSGTAGYITMVTNASERMRVNYNGNVGINDTNPTKKLQVNGQTKFYEYSGAHLTNQATSNFNFETLANDTASTSGGSVGAFIKLTATPPGATSTWSTFRARAYGENTKGNTDGMITFFSEYRNYTSTNAVTLNYHAGLYVNPLGVGGLATVTNNYGVFLNPGTTATNNYGVYQNGSSVKNFFQGNVGIGTTTPASKLDVVGTGSFTGQVTIPATPVASTDAASKSYVDNSVAAIITPATPSTVTSTIVGETIEIEFNESATSDIDYYQVWSSDNGGDYGIIGQITSDDFSSTMTVVDTTFVTGGTMSYRIYAVRQGVYSAAATTSKSYTVSALSVTNMTVVNLNTAYYIQYEKPNSRFIDHIEIYMDSQTTLAALNRSNATLVYSGQNASYMRSVGTSSNFHQFWVEVVTS